MAEHVQVQKREYASRLGDANDDTPYVEDIDYNEDHIDVRGTFFQGDSGQDEVVHQTRDSSGRMTFKDSENTTPVSLTTLTTGGSGISEATHEILDTLKHAIAEDSHQQITRSSGKVSNITFWTDSGETQKIREIVITRSAGRVSQVDIIQYDSGGTEKMRVTGTLTRVSGRVDHIDWVETVA